MKIDKIIQIIRNLKEEGEGSIANVVGNGEKSLGYNIQTGTPPVFPSKKKNIYLGKGSRKPWMQRRKRPQV